LGRPLVGFAHGRLWLAGRQQASHRDPERRQETQVDAQVGVEVVRRRRGEPVGDVDGARKPNRCRNPARREAQLLRVLGGFDQPQEDPDDRRGDQQVPALLERIPRGYVQIGPGDLVPRAKRDKQQIERGDSRNPFTPAQPF
jgi:hypothetical protein